MEEETVSIGTKRILLDMKYKGNFKQSVVQKWLRDEHNFFVLVELDCYRTNIFVYFWYKKTMFKPEIY